MTLSDLNQLNDLLLKYAEHKNLRMISDLADGVAKDLTSQSICKILSNTRDSYRLALDLASSVQDDIDNLT